MLWSHYNTSLYLSSLPDPFFHSHTYSNIDIVSSWCFCFGWRYIFGLKAFWPIVRPKSMKAIRLPLATISSPTPHLTFSVWHLIFNVLVGSWSVLLVDFHWTALLVVDDGCGDLSQTPPTPTHQNTNNPLTTLTFVVDIDHALTF